MIEMSKEEIFIRTKIGMLLSETLMIGSDRGNSVPISLHEEYEILYPYIEKIIKDFKDYGIIN